jgi:predicted DNA-binding transcriptional regulator YafY
VQVPSQKEKKGRVTKISIERFSKLLRLIRQRQGASMRLIREELGVSEASVKRDIDFLRDRLECPLRYDMPTRQWVLDDDGKFELPGIWFEASEVFALLMMLQLVDGVQPGLLEAHVGPLKSRLQRMLNEGTNSARHLDSTVKIIHFAPRKVEPKHFQTVANALLQSKQVRLQYWNRDKGERTERIISPLQLVHYRENWLLDSWCHEREGLRSFALETIEKVEVLDAASKPVTKEILREHFQSGYGIFAGKALNWAVLKFTPSRAQFVSLEVWHPDQRSKWLPDQSYVLEVPYSNDQELLMDLMRHGADVEVLDPPELRDKIYSRLLAAANQYLATPIKVASRKKNPQT